MEAHQNLGVHFPVSCCSRMEIAVSNADRFPQTVTMELVLRDTALEHGYAMSLGRQPVNSTPQWRPGQEDEPRAEALVFAFPPSPLLQLFDEITVRFHLGAIRRTRSARVAIERFLLVPRGR